jgi:hypothetical protein
MELTASGILSRMLATVKARFGPLLGLWALYFVGQIGFSFVFVLIAGAGAMAGAGLMDSSGGGAAALGGGMIVMMIVFYVAYLLIYVASYASMAHHASPLINPSFGESLSAGVRAALPLLGATLLLLLAYLVLAIPFALLFAAIGSAGEAASLLFGLLLLPVLVYLGCRLSILFPLATVEGIRSPVGLITRSWALTGGRVLPIFLATLAFSLVAIVLVVLVFLPVFGPLLSGEAPDPAAGVGLFLLSGIGMLVLVVVLTIMGAAMSSAIHAGVSDASGDSYSDTFG